MQKSERAVWIFLFTGIFLAWPLAWVYLFNPALGRFYPRFGVFDNGVLALFALTLLCAFRGKTPAFLRRMSGIDRLILAALGVFFLNLLLQQFFFFSLFRLASGLMLTFVILFGAVFSAELKTLLPKFSFVLLLLNLLQFASDFFWHFRNPAHVVAGLASNWNWSATLLTVSAVLSVPLLPDRFRNKKFLLTVLLGAGIAATLLIPDFPKGTWLGIAGAVFLLAELALPKRTALAFPAAVLVLFCLTAGYFVFHPLPALFQEDIRRSLFEGAWKLGAVKFPFGCGQDLFAAQINVFLPAEYHLSGYAANIHDHPHNSFLLLFAEQGVAGLFLICAWITGMFCVFFRARKTGDFSLTVLLTAFCCFSLHGMADMTLAVWPCRMLFFLLAGMLWAGCGEPVPAETAPAGKTGRIAAFLFGLLTLALLIPTAAGGFLLWRGSLLDMAGRRAEAQIDYRQSIKFRPTAKALYGYAVNAFYYERDFPRAERALLELFPLGYDGYIHSDYLIARSRSEQGNFAGALPFYEREELRYPFGSVTFYDHGYALHKLGRKREASQAMDACLLTLKLKGRTLNDLPLLRQRPALDFRLPRKQVRKIRAGLETR